MSSDFILALDQGTTGTRAIVYNSKAVSVASVYKEFRQYYPQPGWVEHDPDEIWRSTQAVISKALKKIPRAKSNLAAIGITNQRETTVIWDKNGPLHSAIVWQDRRTAGLCDRLKKRGLEHTFRHKTGLVLDPYFSASKIRWLLENSAKIKRAVRNATARFGTIDSWLLWKLTGGQSHVNDVTNASRTLLYNIRTQKWDPQLLKIFKVPASILPRVQDSGSLFGRTSGSGVLPRGVPIYSMIGDQQAALYGQGCYQHGSVKNTYGTGCFIVMNIGKKLAKIPHGLLATLACDKAGKPVYALEGSIFIAGAAIQWLRDGLQLIKHASETEHLIRGISDTGGVVVIPAFAGLGSPHWNPHVRGVISGITRGTQRGHIIRATLESLAHQTADVMQKMQLESGKKFRELRVDGGATANKFLMSFQADMLQIPILVSDIPESTAWGAAKLAGIKAGLWSLKSVDKKRRYKRFSPKMSTSRVHTERTKWHSALNKLLK